MSPPPPTTRVSTSRSESNPRNVPWSITRTAPILPVLIRSAASATVSSDVAVIISVTINSRIFDIGSPY